MSDVIELLFALLGLSTADAADDDRVKSPIGG